MTTSSMRIGDCEVRTIGVVKGLRSEVREVQRAFDELKPDRMAVSLSKEELYGLRNIPEDFEPDPTRYEEIYSKWLGKFGQVAIPPPCYVAAVELADHFKIPLVPVDMDEDDFSALYCKVVPGTVLMRHSTRLWLLKNHRFTAKTPQEFVMQLDTRVNNMAAFKTIERKRAETMAEGIIEASEGAARLLAVIEFERVRDVEGIVRDRLQPKKE
jgi:hypothetical protein